MMVSSFPDGIVIRVRKFRKSLKSGQVGMRGPFICVMKSLVVTYIKAAHKALGEARLLVVSEQMENGGSYFRNATCQHDWSKRHACTGFSVLRNKNPRLDSDRP